MLPVTAMAATHDVDEAVQSTAKCRRSTRGSWTNGAMMAVLAGTCGSGWASEQSDVSSSMGQLRGGPAERKAAGSSGREKAGVAGRVTAARAADGKENRVSSACHF